MQPTTHTNKITGRYELKYLIPSALKTALMHDITKMTKPDAYSLNSGNSYTVRSLYFDSRNRIAYHEKMAGVLHRRKFRIRTYLEAPDALFLEIKERVSNRIIKRKHPLTETEYTSLISRQTPTCLLHTTPVIKAFNYHIKKQALSPLLVIDYKRQPLVGRIDQRLRITFDTMITATKARKLAHTASSFAVLPPGQSVLEIKFDHTMPHWVHHLIKKYCLQDTQYSKYCLGLEHLTKRGVMHIV